MIVMFDWRAFIAVMVFLICFAVAVVKTFAFLNGVAVSMSIYVLAILISMILYAVFSIATAAIKSGLGN